MLYAQILISVNVFFHCCSTGIAIMYSMAVDKFLSWGCLTFTAYHKQLCAVHYALYPTHRNAKNLSTALVLSLVCVDMVAPLPCIPTSSPFPRNVLYLSHFNFQQ